MLRSDFELSRKKSVDSTLDSMQESRMEMNDIDTEKNNSKKTLLNYVQELGVVLKTSFPLLALSAEKMIDQLAFKLRGNAQEELFRHLCKLEKQTFQAWI